MITVLSGKNIFSLNQYKNEVVDQQIKDYGEYSIEILNASEVSFKDILINVQTMPFLVEKKLIIISDIAVNKDATEDVEKLLEVDNQNVEILIVESNFDKRSSLYKTLKKKTNFKEFNDLDDYTLSKWISEIAKKNSYKISNSEISYLVQRVGSDQQKLFNELNKLASYENNITKENIELLTTKSIKSTTFDMLDSLFQGNINRAVEFYNEQRALNVEPQMIVGSLVWQLRVILAVKYSKENIDQTAKLSKFSPYSLRKSQNLADKLSKDQLKDIVSSILQLDIDSKSKSIDIDQAIKFKLLTISKQVS